MFAEFIKVPMMRHLEDDMASMNLSEDDIASYRVRRERLTSDLKKAEESLAEINACIARMQGFKLRFEARGGGA